MPSFVSRAGQKLDHALDQFGLEVAGRVCADLGCNTGGFVDCLLQRGAARVYAVDTGYGALAWTLRKDPRVVVMERTNALHVVLPEPVQLVSIDVAWTRQKHILPAAVRLLAPGGDIVSLIKPHYEAEKSQLRGGVLSSEALPGVLEGVFAEIAQMKLQLVAHTPSPLTGAKGNVEHLAWVRPMEGGLQGHEEGA